MSIVFLCPLSQPERIYFCADVDDEANNKLVEFQGVKSFPTIVAVEGNYILGKSEGYKVRLANFCLW